MGGRLFELDREALKLSGIAGAALALMLWPHAHQDRVRLDWQDRLARAFSLMEAVPSGEVAADDPLAADIEAVQKQFEYDSRLNKAIRGSLALGHLAMPWLKQASHGEMALFPGMRSLTKADLLRSMDLSDSDNRDQTNFNRSLWNRWLPSVHLAAAMRIVLQGGERAGTDIDYQTILGDIRLLKWWLEEAERIEPAAERAFPAISSSIVRIRIV